MKTRLQVILWPAAGLAVFFGIWHLVSHSLENAFLLPPPSAVATALVDLIKQGTLWGDIGASLKRVLTGFALAGLLAVPLALVLAYFVTLRRLVMSVVSLLRPIPPIAWIPLAMLWFGLGDKPGYFITGLASFFPIFLNAFAGGLAVEPEHLNAARCLGAKRWAILRRVYLPSALPSVWTGLRIGLGQAWMAVVTAELIAAQSGLGFLIQMSRLSLETANVLVGMLVIGVIGALMTAVLTWLERFVLPWRVNVART
ncbi:MAG: ABC transporter permease [Nibricoccus sp.]